MAQQYPNTRLRRIRFNGWSRKMFAENTLNSADFILPIFIIEGNNKKIAIDAMPGVYRYTADLAVEFATKAYKLGIQAIVLFPSISTNLKNQQADEAYNENGLVQTTVRALKKAVPNLGVITDIALDPYTIHGQDGLIDDNGYVLNDETIKVLVKQALSHAKAGADTLSPSDMMDGRIGVIRQALEQNNYVNTQLFSYAAKYASSYYSPFRDAVSPDGNLGKSTKDTYQMHTANSDESLNEIAMDINEGADAIIIKPGLLCLDIVQRAKQNFNSPIISYHVSGEYSMLKASAAAGFLDEKKAVLEAMLACKRAGANVIITYYAIELAQWLAHD